MKVNLKEICAINKCAASTEEIRYYLNGVFVHSDAAWVYFVATDGHVMIVHRAVNTDGMDWKFIIPRKMLESFKFSARDTGEADLLNLDGDVIISRGGSTSTEREVDGTFPDYSRVLSRDAMDVEAAQFIGSKLADLDAFAKAFGTHVIVSPRGDGPALVTFGRGDIYGAVMPVLKFKQTRPFAAKPPF